MSDNREIEEKAMDDKIHNLRDALEWLDRRIRDEAELDGEMTNEHAIELAFIQSMLAKFPLRNCDVGTAEEQTRRMVAEYCAVQKSCYESPSGRECPLYEAGVDCRLRWAQMPYEAKEGGTI